MKDKDSHLIYESYAQSILLNEFLGIGGTGGHWTDWIPNSWARGDTGYLGPAGARRAFKTGVSTGSYLIPGTAALKAAGAGVKGYRTLRALQKARQIPTGGGIIDRGVRGALTARHSLRGAKLGSGAGSVILRNPVKVTGGALAGSVAGGEGMDIKGGLVDTLARPIGLSWSSLAPPIRDAFNQINADPNAQREVADYLANSHNLSPEQQRQLRDLPSTGNWREALKVGIPIGVVGTIAYIATKALRKKRKKINN